MIRPIYAAAAAVLVILALSVGPVVAQAKFSPVINGTADIKVLPIKAEPDYKAKVVRTVIKVKNVSTTGSIALLKVTQYWWDKANSVQPVTATDGRVRKNLQPGEEATITLELPIDSKMYRDTYVFSHKNGKINLKQVRAF